MILDQKETKLNRRSVELLSDKKPHATCISMRCFQSHTLPLLPQIECLIVILYREKNFLGSQSHCFLLSTSMLSTF